MLFVLFLLLCVAAVAVPPTVAPVFVAAPNDDVPDVVAVAILLVLFMLFLLLSLVVHVVLFLLRLMMMRTRVLRYS